jgi:tRNA dimethylallyltransferase
MATSWMSSTILKNTMSLENTKELIVILGPTAIGKTALSVALAQQLGTEIISCDSRQFFKEMNIGTAVPSVDELDAAPHHFIQHISIQDEYNVGQFERDALKKLEELFLKHQQVIMVGGSGLYIDAVCKGLDHFPETKPEVRSTLREEYETKGLHWLQEEVKKLDPEYWAMVDQKNAHRLLRCLEVFHSSGNTFSSYRKNESPKRPFQIRYLGLKMERELLYDRINRRVDMMMENGLLAEVEALIPHQHLNALQTVGYRELFDYFNGTHDLDRATTLIKQNTRRFAKRQLTWLKRYSEADWHSSTEEALNAFNR